MGFKEFLEEENLLQENIVNTMFSKLVKPIAVSFAKQAQDVNKQLDKFAKALFNILKKWGIDSYEIRDYSGIKAHKVDSNQLELYIEGDFVFYYDNLVGVSEMDLSDFLMKKAGAKFVNPAVDDTKRDGRKYVAFSFATPAVKSYKEKPVTRNFR